MKNHVEPFTQAAISPPDDGRSVKERLDYCYEKLENKEAHAIVDVDATMRFYLLENCANLAWVPTISFSRSRWVLLMGSQQAEFASNVSAAISHLALEPEYEQI